MKLKSKRRRQRKPLNCLLCGQPATIEALWFPAPWQLARGRIIRYRLCDRCYARPGHAEAAESVIEQHLSGMN